MKILTRENLKSLVEKGQGPCLSLYMGNPAIGEPRQGQIRFKSMLQNGEQRLKELGMKEQDARAFLNPARELLANSLFWQNLNEGLALFLSPDIFLTFNQPIKFHDVIVTSDHFHIKPLFPLLGREGRFYVLGISQKGIRLIEGTRFSAAREVDVESLPQDIIEALGFDTPERQFQYHAVTPDQPGGKGYIMHSQGWGAEVEKKYILKFFQKIDKGISDLLGEGQAPLVLAGVDFLLPLYKEANTYPCLMDEGINGNPDLLSPQELGEKGWEIVHPFFKKEEQKFAELYIEMKGTGKTSTDVEETAAAAYIGKIDTVFVALGNHIWGSFDEKAVKATIHEEKKVEDIDLLDFIATHSLLRGGRVYVLPAENIPDKGNVAALFRF
ncbi:hypothetical protein [Aminobacterium mobile]|uniref:baeRF7 domain-containing protein n=1 Tax=Aminobacterium mobile TaxID=81467 RepID=UPI0004650176|nr:hypothetical protein [Aminobacterium mobile]